MPPVGRMQAHARGTFFPGHRLELVLADVSELILGQVHKQQNRRQFPIKVELVFSELLAEKLIARALVRQADFTDKWIIDLLSDKAPPGPKPCASVAQLVTDEWPVNHSESSMRTPA